MRAIQLVLAALLTLALAARSAPAAIYTVGDDSAPGSPPCTHSNLPSALLSAAINAGPDEVRVAQNLTYTDELVHLTNWGPTNTLTIAGGYSDCGDTTSSGYTIIDGRSNAPVFEIDTESGGNSQVTLRALDVQGSGEQGILVEGNSVVTLDRVWVRNNAGGGIDVTGGAYVDVESDSTIQSNSTTGFGGGVRCFGSGSELRIAGRIENNDAAAGGGGIYADSACIITLVDPAEVNLNAAPDGAGIYAAGTSFVTADGGTFGIEISFNDASDQGGGVYATGNGTVVSLVNVQVENNDAGTTGGGLFATTQGLIGMGRDSGPCRPVQPCSTLSGNTLDPTSDYFGAAARAEAGGDINIYQTHVEGNGTGHSSIGSILSASGAGSMLRLEGDVLWDNDGLTLVHIATGASGQLAFLTASANGTASGVARPLRVDGSGATATVNSSIFWPNGPISAASGGTITEADCLILSDASGLPGGGTRISMADPLFLDAAAGNLRVPVHSPAVDFCDTAMYAPTLRDVDFELRGSDLVDNPNGSPGAAAGIHDLGFDEIRQLFANGFESGTLSVWSGWTP